jgi:hypothetical protein
MQSMSLPKAMTGPPVPLVQVAVQPVGQARDAARDLEAVLLQHAGDVFRGLDFLEAQLAEREDLVVHHLGQLGAASTPATASAFSALIACWPRARAALAPPASRSTSTAPWPARPLSSRSSSHPRLFKAATIGRPIGGFVHAVFRGPLKSVDRRFSGLHLLARRR